MSNNIIPQNITFVVCGKITKNIKKCLSSIRCFFPYSRIILSTWINEKINFSKDLYDELILNDASKVPNTDIRCSVDPDNFKLNSFNLQMYSIFNGLKKVKSKYAVRFRTDFELKNSNFLKMYIQLNTLCPLYDDKLKFFSQKILIPKVYTRDPEKIGGSYAFDTSDLFAFGMTEDLLKLWNGVFLEKETLEFFSSSFPKKSYFNPHSSNSQYTMEQYRLINLIKSSSLNIPIPESYIDHSNKEFIKYTYKIFLSNFFILSFKQLGLQTSFKKREKKDKSLFEHEKYLKLYSQNFNINIFALKLAILKEKIQKII